MDKIKFVATSFWDRSTMTLDSKITEDQWQQVKTITESLCKLPQKQYVLKVDKSLNFKNVKHEKKSIQSHSNCQHSQGV